MCHPVDRYRLSLTDTIALFIQCFCAYILTDISSSINNGNRSNVHNSIRDADKYILATATDRVYT